MARKAKFSATRESAPRFGIGEWFGYRLTELSPAQRLYYASEVLKPRSQQAPQPCPFQLRKAGAICKKDGGVCSLRLYSRGLPENGRGLGVPVTGVQGDLRATCPGRFHEGLEIFKWVGETILGDPNPLLVGEVGFLEASATTDAEGGDDVGRIDMVLVNSVMSGDGPMAWTALEIQAVYFSGDAMKADFLAYSDPTTDSLIFPPGRRRPDYRSSGPKRLMPQLQIKVPTLRRWGKKMAVVVDRTFFDSMGEMDNVSDVSNADIAWFIVKFEEMEGQKRARLIRDEIRYATLERSVEGLTGGKPVPLHQFELRIKDKIVHPHSTGSADAGLSTDID